MDRFIDKESMVDIEELNITKEDLLYFLKPCGACTRNFFREDCYKKCRLHELWLKLLPMVIDFTDIELDFLLESEEERINKYGLEKAYNIYISCKNKLEKQKENIGYEK